VKALVRHETIYTYSAPVWLEPHVLRLIPRQGAGMHVHSQNLQVHPTPAGMNYGMDLEGNTVAHAHFNGRTGEFWVLSSFEVSLSPANPLDFVLYPTEAATLPVTCHPLEFSQMSRYLGQGGGSAEVAAFAESIAAQMNHETIPFLMSLLQTIHERCPCIHRAEGAPWPASETLRVLTGSCRDLAVLFIECCRAVGVPARFVSGYVLNAPEGGRRDLHAWAEVYLPGAGWRGFDPAQGLVTGAEHLVLAAAANPLLAAPVAGAFRGNNIRSTLSARISIERDEVESAA
jgi:transglutaminase-like putative cysteine protease